MISGLFDVVVIMTTLMLIFSPGMVHSIASLNGFGQPVDWWFILKLPEKVASTTPHCSSCGTPSCPHASQKRSRGLCYLYADSKDPELRDFRTKGYDCLGQGKNDPLSQTLRQLQEHRASSHYAHFNDQFNGLANAPNASFTCTGQSTFNAHSKGLVQQDASGGYFLQTSTPNFPDPSSPAFIPLGCQKDDNVDYAQHMFSFSLNATAMETLASALVSGRFCSANFYRTKDMDFAHRLMSPSLRFPNASTVNSSLYQALVHPRHASNGPMRNVHLDLTTRFQSIPIHVFIKTKWNQVIPWAYVANELQSDLTVISWWDPGYGIPSICASDEYQSSANQFCLVDPDERMNLTRAGRAKFNIENAYEAKWHDWRWKLSGMVEGGNHGKYGIVTPRPDHDRRSSMTDHFVIAGDMNNEGFPCSRACGGSQGGRAGAFFGFSSPRLWASLARELIAKVCACHSSCSGTNAFTQCRMCDHGCVHHIEGSYSTSALPKLSGQATTFWQASPVEEILESRDLEISYQAIE